MCNSCHPDRISNIGDVGAGFPLLPPVNFTHAPVTRRSQVELYEPLVGVGNGFIDRRGHRHGKLTVVALSPQRTKSRNVRWFCACDCGRETVVEAGDLVRGHTASCGNCIVPTVLGQVIPHGTTETSAFVYAFISAPTAEHPLGEILYVGEAHAHRLRHRMNDHLRGSDFYQLAERVQFIEFASKQEAVEQQNSMIRALRPRFNRLVVQDCTGARL